MLRSDKFVNKKLFHFKRWNIPPFEEIQKSEILTAILPYFHVQISVFVYGGIFHRSMKVRNLIYCK